MDLNKRQKEYEKYDRAYKQPSYRMGNNRKQAAHEVIRSLEAKGTLLDIGCGRGEMVEFAKGLGFDAIGIEVVDYLLNDSVIYGEAHDLPFKDNMFDVVTSFDAFEHFLPEDTEAVLSEIDRVSKKAIIICIGNFPSGMNMDNYHINLRPNREWEELMNRLIDGKVEHLPKTHGTKSDTWVIYKE